MPARVYQPDRTARVRHRLRQMAIHWAAGARLLGGIGSNRPAVAKAQVGGGQHGPPAPSATAIARTRTPTSQLHPTARKRGCWAEPVALLSALDALSVAVLGGPPPTPPGVLGGR
jgi:hypothetical protein